MTEELQDLTIDKTPISSAKNSLTRVLLIEDNPDDAFLVRESLIDSTGARFSVEWAERLAQGLEILENEEIDVVLLDLSLPDSSGTETFHRVYKQAPRVPVVVLTGLEDEMLGAELVREGGQDYLVKGHADGTLLTRCINYAIERKQAEEVIRRLADETSVLAEIGRIISSSLQIDEVYERFSEQVIKLIPCDRIGVKLIDADENTFTNAYVFGVDIPHRRQGDYHTLANTCEEEIVHTRKGRIIQGGAAESVAERDADPVFQHDSGLRSHAAVPLISNDQVIGILQLRSIEPDAFSDRDLEVLEQIGAQIAGAIASSQLYAQIKQAEESLKQQAKELTRSNQELEQFAYVASHDLQEPLRMVKSYVQFLASDYQGKLDEDADRYINYAVDGANRMKVLIDDLLAFSRVGTQGKPFEPTDCNDVMEQVIADLQAVIRDAQAKVSSDALPTVMADVTQLTQLLRNLISNGIKYCSSETPHVHVSAEQIQGAEEDETEPAWRFSVRDNGIGIAPNQYKRIFLMFQRLHHRSEYPGTGIGLAICQKIVERHGGRIWVESQPGNGSTFYFTIPTTQKEKSKMSQENSSNPTAGAVNILLVEDNPGDVELTERILKDSKFDLNINVAEDGEAAMTILRREGAHSGAARPDLILLDLNMPKMDGYQVLDALKHDDDLRSIPVMILTSTQGERDRLFGLGISPNRYCNKPLNLGQFDTLVGLLQSGAVPPETQPKPQPEEAVVAEEPKRKWWPFGKR